MLRHWILLAGCAAIASLPSIATAADPPGRDPFADASAPAGVDAQRAWLQEQLIVPLTDRVKARSYQAKLDRMTPAQVSALVEKIERQRASDAGVLEEQARAQLQQAAAVRQHLNAQHQRQQMAAAAAQQAAQNAAFLPPAYPYYYPTYYPPGRVVGYVPVVTWLPHGTSLGASGVISPDRRHVRTSVTPFFSRVGPSRNTAPKVNRPKPWRGGPVK